MNKYSYMDLYKLAGDISNRCILRRSDVNAVLTELTELIPELMLENCSIQLGDLGTFSLHT